MWFTQSWPTLCDPMDGSPPGFSVLEIFQTKKLEWVAISFSKGSSQPRNQTRSPALQAESSSSIKYLYYSKAGCQIGSFNDFHYKYRNYFLYPLLFLPQNWRGNKIHSIMLSMDLGLACKYNLWCYILQNNISFTFKWCVNFLPDDLAQKTIYGNSFNLFKSNFT